MGRTLHPFISHRKYACVELGIHMFIYIYTYLLGGFKHGWIIFHFIYGMSSFPLNFTPWFFRGVGIPPPISPSPVEIWKGCVRVIEEMHGHASVHVEGGGKAKGKIYDSLLLNGSGAFWSSLRILCWIFCWWQLLGGKFNWFQLGRSLGADYHYLGWPS